MAQTIKIKRSQNTAAPGSLTAGELAYSQDSNKLFIGRPSDGNVTTIGGDLYVNMLDHTLGTLTINSAITTDANNKVDQFKTANLTIGANSVSSGSGDIDLVAAQNLDIDAGTIDLSTQATDFRIIDNSSTGMTISTGDHTYLTFDSTNTTEKILVGRTLDLNGLELILDADGDTSITADTDDRIDFKIGGTNELAITGSTLRPGSDASIGLGTSSIKFANAFIDNIKIDGNTISSEDTNGNINLTPNGSGQVVLDGFAFPVNGSGTNGQFIRQDSSGNLEFATVVSTLTLSADSGTNDTINTGETLTFTGGEGIDTSVTDNTITITGEEATTANKGVASFATANFTVTSGHVATKNITLGTSTLINGSTTTDIAGLTSVVVDDLTLNGSTVSTSTGNNNIVLSPHGTGTVTVPSGYKDRSGFTTNSLVSKEYVDAIKQNLDIKDSVRLASTANVSLTAGSSGLEAGDSIDGVALIAGDRVLLKSQTNAAENGIYVAVASAGTPARSVDANSNDKVNAGMFVFVEEGTVNADNGFVLTTNDAISLGSTDLTFTQFSGAGQIVAGDALSKSANTLNVNDDNVTIEVSSDALRIKGISQTRKGDLILGNTTNDAGYDRLPIGTADQILTVQSGTLAYTSTLDGGTF